MSVMASMLVTTYLHHPIPFTPYLQAQKETTVSNFYGINFCDFCGELVIREIFILKIALANIWLAAIGELDTCTETKIYV